jgi:hypothetical protein
VKNLLQVAPLFLALGGCAIAGAPHGNWDPMMLDSQSAPPSTDAAAPGNSPRLIISVNSGVPVLAIPLGGGIYLPVTGEPPTPGIPLNP